MFQFVVLFYTNLCVLFHINSIIYDFNFSYVALLPRKRQNLQKVCIDKMFIFVKIFCSTISGKLKIVIFNF